MDAGELQIVVERADKTNPKKHPVLARLGGKLVYSHEFNLMNARERDRFVHKVKEIVPAVGIEEIEKELLQQIDLGIKAHENSKLKTPTVETDASALLAEMPQDIRDEAETMLSSSDLIKIVIEDIAASGVAGETELTACIYLIGTSRLLERPLSAIVQGPSSSGKSYPLEKIVTLFPDEAVIKATEMSPQALYYMPPGSLKHRFVVAGERSRKTDEDAEEATKALRQMISEQRLDKHVVMRTNDKPQTVHLKQEGPIAFIETTTQYRIFDEDRNRCILLGTDEREQQTVRIITRIGDEWAGEQIHRDRERIILKHHAAQRMMAAMPIKVRIPYAKDLAKHFPCKRLEARRAISQLFGMIAASALLHHRQRMTDCQGRLLARREDYELARRLLDGPMSRLLGRRISPTAQRLHERLCEAWASRVFTVNDLVQQENLSESAIRGLVSELCHAGRIDVEEEAHGRQPRRYRLKRIQPDEIMVASLPRAEEVFGDYGCGRADETQLLADPGLLSAPAQSVDN